MAALKYRNWNGRVVGTALQFFIDRHEKQANKPDIDVDICRSEQDVLQSEVSLLYQDNVLATRNVNFLLLMLQNYGTVDAEVEAKLEVFESRKESGLPLPIKLVPFTAREKIEISIDKLPTSTDEEDNIANAIMSELEGSEKAHLTVGGTPDVFIFAFTVKGGDRLYFLTRAFLPMDLPDKFNLKLWFDIEGYPAQSSKTFRVVFKHWNSFKCK